MRASCAATVLALLLWPAAAEQGAGAVLAAAGSEYSAPLSALHYYPGQPANLSCRRAPRRAAASVQLSYYSDETKAVSTTFKQQESVEMYFKLSLAHNDTLVTCSVRAAATATVQLRLLLRGSPPPLGWEVNGLRVRGEERGEPGLWGEERELRHEYRFMWDERMTVRLVLGAAHAARCTVTGDNFPGAWIDRLTAATGAGELLANETLAAKQSGTTLRCRVRLTTTDDPFTGDSLLTLVFVYYDLVPFVGGLTMANVELLYVAGNITTLYYDDAAPYTGNGTHYLSCNPDPVSWWVWNPGEVDADADRTLAEGGFPYAFRLFPQATWTLLQCVREASGDKLRRTVHVWLHRHPPPPPSTTLAPPSSSSMSSPIAPPSPSTPPDAATDPSSKWWVGALSAAVLAALLSLAIVVAMRAVRRVAAAPPAAENIYELVPEPLTRARGPGALPGSVPAAAGRHYDSPYDWQPRHTGDLHS